MPLFFMAVTRQKKEEVLKSLKEGFKKAKIVMFVNFHGLNVKAANELRKILRGLGVSYGVAKKTLIKKALEGFSFEGVLPNLEGEIAVAVSENDSLETIKAVENFAKKNKTLKFAGGIFENKYIEGKTVVMLANIPPREILLGQLVNIINSPVRGLVVTLNGVTRKLVSVLSQIKK